VTSLGWLRTLQALTIITITPSHTHRYHQYEHASIRNITKKHTHTPHTTRVCADSALNYLFLHTTLLLHLLLPTPTASYTNTPTNRLCIPNTTHTHEHHDLVPLPHTYIQYTHKHTHTWCMLGLHHTYATHTHTHHIPTTQPPLLGRVLVEKHNFLKTRGKGSIYRIN